MTTQEPPAGLSGRIKEQGSDPIPSSTQAESSTSSEYKSTSFPGMKHAQRNEMGSDEVPFSLSDDADVHENELEEFYSYVEAPLFVENYESWIEWCDSYWDQCVPVELRSNTWTALPLRIRRPILQRLLAGLDLQDPAARMCASRALLYHLQGSFQSVDNDQEQVRCIRENAQCVVDLGGLEDIFLAMKRSCWKHEWFSSLPDYLESDTNSERSKLMTPDMKADYLEEINVEVTVHFAQLYSILEMLRGDNELSEALMALDPPLTEFLFQLVANLREKSIKGFPVKKLVLVLWKSLLATLGGNDVLREVKIRRRQQEGLDMRTKQQLRDPTAPEDVRQFRAGLMAKYPTLLYSPAMKQLQKAEDLAMATQPLPTRHASDENSIAKPMDLNGNATTLNTTSVPTSNPLPLRQGKLKFQTDQSKPFVLPYTPENPISESVPASIQEALQLYQSHLYIDTGVWQTCQIRQELLKEMQGEEYSRRDSNSEVQQLEQTLDALQMTSESRPEMDQADSNDTDIEERLQWVDRLYGAMLPQLQSAIIVLLKLMLATTTSGGTNSAYSRAVADGMPSEKAPNPTLEDVDIVRHREILNKAISSLLLLCLRWFKASHVMKFEYLTQIMLDSNILLLILKMFGLQETSEAIRWRCEAEPFGMFAYCRRMREDQHSTTPQAILSECQLRIGNVWNEFPNDPPRLSHDFLRDGDKNGVCNAFSWRNFATTMHLTRILHKICHRKVHRILLLVQYKSAAILKRPLRVQHQAMQRYILKLIKSQVPFCGRKWRQSNMRIITQIYLMCNPNLHDEWLGGSDIDAEVEASLPEEQTLRSLIQFYNQTRFAARTAVAGAIEEMGPSQEARRMSPVPREENRSNSDALPSLNHAASAAFEREAFPIRQKSVAVGTPGRYISDDAVEGYLDVYEDVLREIFSTENQESSASDTETSSEADAPRTPSKSGVHSNPTDDSDLTKNEQHDENQNLWENVSPREMQMLASSPKIPSVSPRYDRSRQVSWSSQPDPVPLGRRVNSSPAQLHPKLHWNMEDLVEDALSTEQGDAKDTASPKNPQETTATPSIPDSPLPSPKPGGIDEVEHIFGA
ncbi:Factor arrest protein 11 [Malassezia psittaci]|uniref:Factor arrest protein 11 n=1 Tax=Malassezia psittaci TaxID=1821823 RepID=A0AAF0JLE3_9BASI|nr:Factor arrest protein 11 [Malassezia psittaci]